MTAGPRVPAPVDEWARARGPGPREAVAYVRVSTAEQADSGLGVAAQVAAINAEAKRRGYSVMALYSDAGTSANARERPGLESALALVEAKPGRVLMVAKLDRLARSLSAYAALIDRSRAHGWTLLPLDAPEAATPQGEAMQGITAIFAQLEGRLISQRTREALAAARARGVTLGRPVRPNTRDATAAILSKRRRGLSTGAIAADLNDAGAPGPEGGVWSRHNVADVLRRAGVTLTRGRPTKRRRGPHTRPL